jgi:hypothetical protein
MEQKSGAKNSKGTPLGCLFRLSPLPVSIRKFKRRFNCNCLLFAAANANIAPIQP